MANDRDNRLWKFIYHPVVLASVDEDDFAKAAAHSGPGDAYEHDCKTVASVVSLSTRDFKSAVGAVGKELFKFLRIVRVANAIAQQDRSRLEIVGLPGVKEPIGSRQGENIVRVR